MACAIDLVYSFGGTKEFPLVQGRVPFQYDPTKHACLQEALLERTELFIHSLKDVFDEALAVFDGPDGDKLRALDVMVATVTYTTNTILVASPSVHYAIMFERVQEIFKRREAIQSVLGDKVAAAVEDILKPVWINLRAIDNSFSE